MFKTHFNETWNCIYDWGGDFKVGWNKMKMKYKIIPAEAMEVLFSHLNEINKQINNPLFFPPKVIKMYLKTKNIKKMYLKIKNNSTPSPQSSRKPITAGWERK